MSGMKYDPLNTADWPLNAPEEPARVATQLWERNPDSPEGYMRVAYTKTIGEVLDEIRAIVGEYPEGGEEYFSVTTQRTLETPWPDGQIIVYPVTGGSEGHYIHVSVIDANKGWADHQLVLTGKTFGGFDAAWAFAKRLAEMLEV